MSRFAAIKPDRSPQRQMDIEPASAGSKPVGRGGKKAISGYFSPELSYGLNLLALEQRTSLQALMGEAFDDLLRKYSKHPFGER